MLFLEGLRRAVRRRHAVQCIAGLCLPGIAAAQHYPGISYDPPTLLAPGVRYLHARDASVPWQIDIIELDLANPNVELVPVLRQSAGVTEKTSAMAARVGAVAAVNGGYFTAATASSLSYVKIDGAVLGQNASTRPPRSTFGCSAFHNAALVQSPIDASGSPQPALPAWSSVVDALGAGPNLVTAGAVDVQSVAEGFDAASGINPTSREPRTALGWDSATRRVWLVTVDGRQSGWSAGMTLTELAWLLIDLGATQGLNYDGGGSTTCWVNGAVVNRPSDGTERGVVTGWAVVPSLVVDNQDAEAEAAGAGWFASANAGYYGGNSLINAGGDFSGDRVIWRAALQRGGLYDVYAWWVGSSNRDIARYEVHHRGGVSDVVMDQTTGGSRWNLLGTFDLDAGDASYVQLSDEAAAGKYTSADAVRFVARTPDAPAPLVDDADAAFGTAGAWAVSSAQPDRYGATYRYAAGGAGADEAQWALPVDRSGRYEVCAWYSASSNRAVDAPYVVPAAEGDVTVRINQQKLGGRWVSLGEYELLAGTRTVRLSNAIASSSQYVVADAVMAVRAPTPPGDADFDGDVDVADAMALAECVSGPDIACVPPCDVLDLDADGDVDLMDFGKFQDAVANP